MRGGHDGARPGSRECGAIGKSLSYLTWPELAEESFSAIGCLQPRACANLACVAGPDPAPPAAVYHLRGSDSQLSRAPLPPLSDLFDDLFRSFLHFLRASTCYIAVTIQNIT